MMTPKEKAVIAKAKSYFRRFSEYYEHREFTKPWPNTRPDFQVPTPATEVLYGKIKPARTALFKAICLLETEREKNPLDTRADPRKGPK